MNLGDKLGDIFLEELKPVIEGAQEDIKRYAFRLGSIAAAAALSGDSALMQQAKDQVKVLAEIQRIRLKEVEWHVVEKIFILVVKSVAAGVGILK